MVRMGLLMAGKGRAYSVAGDDVANVLLFFSAGDQTQVHMQAKQALHL
jgi:hypothetical protein